MKEYLFLLLKEHHRTLQIKLKKELSTLTLSTGVLQDNSNSRPLLKDSTYNVLILVKKVIENTVTYLSR